MFPADIALTGSGLRRAAGRPLRRTVVAVVAVVAVLLALTSPALGATTASDPPPDEAAVTTYAGPAGSANARYLVELYSRLLGRGADTGGLDFFLARLASGGDLTRQQVARALLFSDEGSRQEVRRAYDELLGRTPDGGGEDYWTTHLRTHGVLDLRVLILASDEYATAAGGSDAAWLEAVYHDVLGRASDDGGRPYWLGLRTAGVPRALIVAGIYRSDESLGRRVDTYHSEALGRSPSTAERGAAIGWMRADGERSVRARLWASDEAFEPFLQAVWP
ncbi:MAG: DUF4214 domain-containing protein [Acidimicrobiales bacterium]